MSNRYEIRLRKLLRTMDVPTAKISSLDIVWLLGHLHERNAEHANYLAAMKIINRLWKKERMLTTNDKFMPKKVIIK